MIFSYCTLRCYSVF